MKRTLYLIGMTIAGLTLSACHSNHSKTPSTQVAASQSVETTDTLPDMWIANSQRDKVSTAQEIKRHTLTIIDFWASWCGPCCKEIPNVKACYEKYKDKDFQVVGVSFDTDQKAWEKAVKDLGISWPQLSELKGWDNQALLLYDIRVIPATILYSPDGKVVATQLNGEGLRNKLAEIYDK